MSLDVASSKLRPGFVGKVLRRGPLEAIATAIIAMGVVMLMQPFFLVPIVVFTVLLRKHLLRGITFGAVRK